MCQYCEERTELAGDWAAGALTYVATFIEDGKLVMYECADYDEMSNGAKGDLKDSIEISVCPVCARPLT